MALSLSGRTGCGARLKGVPLSESVPRDVRFIVLKMGALGRKSGSQSKPAQHEDARMSLDRDPKYISAALRPGDKDPNPQRPAGEFIGLVASNDWINKEYKHLVLNVHEHA